MKGAGSTPRPRVAQVVKGRPRVYTLNAPLAGRLSIGEMESIAKSLEQIADVANNR